MFKFKLKSMFNFSSFNGVGHISKFGKSINKRGNIQMSLSWIFMIMVGSFFLLVAYNIIDKYSENEDTKYYLEVKAALSNILINAGQTIGYEENYIQPIDTFFKNSKVEIICNDGLPILSLNDKLDENPDFLKNIPTFMTEIEESEVSFTYLAVENFKIPFKTTNMMAIVSKKNLIVFDSNSDITKILRDKFQDSSYRDSLSFIEADIDSINADEYNDLAKEKSYQTVMFVSDDEVILGFDLADLNTLKGYHLKVSGESTDFKYGDLNYIDAQGDAGTYPYLDFREGVFDTKPVSMITMAIFSNPSTFDCGYKLVVKLSSEVTNFYLAKSKYIEDLAASRAVCSSDLVVTGSGNFDGIFQVEKYTTVSTQIISLKNLLGGESFNNPEVIYSIIDSIHMASQELSDNSCEMIY